MVDLGVIFLRRKHTHTLIPVIIYLFSSGALKQIKSGLWDADNTTLELKCQKAVQKSFKNCIFCDILINIGGELPSVQKVFAPKNIFF